jgi:hypothetical protein
VLVTVTQGSGEAATSGIVLGNPTGVKINKVLSPCFNGTTCTVGTLTAESPVLPSTALGTGMLTLAGSVNSGSLSNPITGEMTISFPPPYQFSVKGPLNLTEHTITFSGVPDIPLSAINFSFTGTPAGPAFTTECKTGTIAASLVPQNGGAPAKVTGPVTNVDCPPPSAKPTATGSLGGLASGKPKLKLHAARGSVGPDISSLSIGLPSGLNFTSKALVCKHGKCASAKGLSVSAAIKSARIQSGKLVITLAHAAASVSVSAHGPLLFESKTLQSKAKKHKTGKLVTHLRVTGANGAATALNVP